MKIVTEKKFLMIHSLRYILFAFVAEDAEKNPESQRSREIILFFVLFIHFHERPEYINRHRENGS